MNKTYKVVWNESLGTWCAISETSKVRGKRSSGKAIVASAVIVASTMSGVTFAADNYVSVNDGGVQSGNYNNDGAGVDGSVAIGPDSSSSGASGVAIGNNADVHGYQGVAIGNNAQAGYQSMALGHDAIATAFNSMALGGNSIAYTDGTALGQGTYANKLATAMGNGSLAVGLESTAYGYSALAGTDSFSQPSAGTDPDTIGKAYATAMGSRAKASVQGSTAIGAGSVAEVESGVALGSSSVANTAAGVVGYIPTGANQAQLSAINATQSTLGAVSVGSAGNTRQITNVAAGTVDTDAVNVAQLKAVQAASETHYVSINDGGVQSGNYNNDGAQGKNSLVVGMNSTTTVNATNNVSVGLGNYSQADNAIAVGSNNYIDINNAVALGINNNVQLFGGTTAVGIGNSSYGRENAIVGNNNKTLGSYHQVFGTKNNVINGSYQSILGYGNTIGGADYNIVIGTNNTIGTGYYPWGDGGRSIAVGQSNSVEGIRSGSFGQDALIKGNNSFSFGGANKVTNNDSTALGISNTISGAGVYVLGATNKVAQSNTFVVGNKVITTQDNSVVLGNESIDRAATTVDKVTINGEDYTVAGAGSAVNGIVSVGKAGAERQIINVAAGEVSATSTDAVNGSQLFATNKAIADSQTHYVSVSDGGVPDTNYNNDGAVGSYAVAVGVGAKAQGTFSSAIGLGATTGTASVALGERTGSANTANSIAIGNAGDGSVAGRSFGTGALSSGVDLVAIGTEAGMRVNGSDNVAIGGEAGNDVRGERNLGLGTAAGSRANGVENIALGFRAGNDIQANRTLSIGSTSKASADDAIAIGTGAQSESSKGLAIGVGATVASGGNDSIAIGSGAQAAAGRAVVIGLNAGVGNINDGDANVLIGMNAGANNDGRWNTAVGSNSGYNTKGQRNTALGDDSGHDVTGNGNIGLGGSAGNSVIGETNLAVGASAGGSVVGSHNTALGRTAGVNVTGDLNTATGLDSGSTVLGNDNVAYGRGSGNQIKGSNNSAVGGGSGYQVSGNYNATLAYGAGAYVTGNANTALGFVAGNKVNGDSNIAIGGEAGSRVNGSRNVALGLQAGQDLDNVNDATSLGSGAKAAVTGSVALGSGSQAIRNVGNETAYVPVGTTIAGANAAGGEVSVGTIGRERRMTNVAAASQDTDAVNLSQLKAAQAAATTHYLSVNDDGTQGGNYNNDGAQGKNSLALGVGAKATGENAIAIGNVTTDAANSIAIGNNNVLSNTAGASTVIGSNNNVTGNEAVALGSNNTVKDFSGVAVGSYNRAFGYRSITVGAENQTDGQWSSAIGLWNTAGGERATALGANNKILGRRALGVGVVNEISSASEYSSAIGAFNKITDSTKSLAAGFSNTITGGDNNNVLGNENQLNNAKNSTAIGNKNIVAQDNTQVLGNNVTTTQANSVILGNASTDRAATAESNVSINGQDYAFAGVGSASNGVVSVGKAGAERQIINVAAGKVSSDSTDAVNGSQLYATNQAITEVGKSAAAAKTEVVEGDNIVVTETQGKNGQSIYNVATAKEVSFDKTTVGTVITDSTTGKITGLTAGEVSATSTDAINGSQLYATNQAIADSKTHYVSVNDDGIQADNYNNDGATGKNALAVGVGSKAAGENAVAIGYNNNVVQDKTVALGSSITTTQANSVVLGNESTDRAATSESKVTILGQDYAFAGVGSASNGVVSVGKVGGERQIINVAAGQLSATSTDAVNGSQLYATNQAISSLQGQVGGAKSTVTEGKNTTITKTTNADGSTDYQVATKDDVSFDSVTVGNIKADAQTNKITGLSDGEVSATSNEAVNGSQLHGTAESVANVLGGNAKVNADGTVSTSNIGNTGKDNVHDAIASLQGQVAGSKTSVSAGKNTVVNSSINADGSNNYQVALADDINLNSVTANQVTANQVKADQVIANQVMANQVNVGKVTIDGTSNKVSGLANGTISKDSTDAINGSQLHQTNSNVAQYLGGGSTLNQDGSIKAPTYNVAGGSYNNVGDALGAVDTRVSNLEQAFYNTNKNVDDLRNDTYAGIAGAMAVGNLPQPTEAGMSMMSAGLSGYRGETAVAVGISAISDSNKIIWKMGASADSRSNIGGAVSVGYQWK
ncbi:YadA-like family protein [Acinetobacter bereziniae]|uniref:YadA-like family protein n=1 Tax=Acinetobacter bereziniae TaxID=106648 RepID=UPI0011176062|nr:YadA-like family protein [Acinetobacter bereziniae]TNL53644.1 outer membrane pathogenesis protein [Acinetobacter bereziniae]TNL64908.1 outer membrane pathogenesis protein [Acinetobacter bereziniae]